MRATGKLFIFIFTLSALVTSAYAQSPREQLKQMVGQLQQSPNDNALREKIIRLAPKLKPAPALPDTAIAFEGRAQFAFKNAKSADDFLAAAQEYEKAVAVAPWVAGYYADLCTIYEKAGKLEEAKRHCGFYLIGLTDPAQMTDVKRRIAGLEFGIEKVNSPQAREATLLEKVEGARFVDHINIASSNCEHIFEIKDGMLHLSLRIYSLGNMLSFNGYNRPGLYSIGRAAYRDGVFTTTTTDNTIFVHRIRPDGQALIGGILNFPESVIPRQ